MMRRTPNFRPTHFTALFDATAYSVALRRYAMLTGAFDRARQEDTVESFGEPARMFGYSTPIPHTQKFSFVPFQGQIEHAGAQMRDIYARMVVQVEALGGCVVRLEHDYCEVEGLTQEQWNAIWLNVLP
jgi:hypothetical protein